MRLLTVAVLLVAVAGCGTSDDERVAGVFREWVVANAENDHERVCALMTTEYRSEGRGARHQRSFEECVADERRRATPATARQRRAMKEFQVANVEVEGDTARAYLRHRGCTLSHTGSEFRRAADGDWRFDGFMATHGFEDRCVK